MARADIEGHVAQWWVGATESKEVELRFAPIRLASLDPGKPDASPWGFQLGPLAIHPVYDPDDDDGAGFRVSVVECGAALADFERIEQAIGFAQDLSSLDWSGKREDAEAIKARPGLKEAVIAANEKWEALLRG